jgi:thioredoxin reductase
MTVISDPASRIDFDVIVPGGGPCGLSAALAFGRARRTVLLADGGPRRNAPALRIHNFVTRDGTTPDEFRWIADEQLGAYPNVLSIAAVAESITGERGAFGINLTSRRVTARRVLLCTGMIDVLPEIDGFAALWGRSIFACPYCHGWEVQNRRFGYLALSAERVHFPLLLRSWSSDLTLFTTAAFEPSSDARAQLEAGGVRLEPRPIARLHAVSGALTHVEVHSGVRVPLDVLFTHPSQQHVAVVEQLTLACTATATSWWTR